MMPTAHPSPEAELHWKVFAMIIELPPKRKTAPPSKFPVAEECGVSLSSKWHPSIRV